LLRQERPEASDQEDFDSRAFTCRCCARRILQLYQPSQARVDRERVGTLAHPDGQPLIELIQKPLPLSA